MASLVPVRSTRTIRKRLRVLCLGRARCPCASNRLSADRAMSLSCGGALCSASRAGPTAPGHRDRRWLVSNSSFSSQDPDQCPVRTRSQPSPRPASSRLRKEGEWLGRSLPRSLCASLLGIGLAYCARTLPSRHGGSMGAARLSCRTMSSVRAGIRQSRRRQFAGSSEAVELFGLRGAAPSATVVERPPSTVRKPHVLSSSSR